jgi:hypothetical protein
LRHSIKPQLEASPSIVAPLKSTLPINVAPPNRALPSKAAPSKPLAESMLDASTLKEMPKKMSDARIATTGRELDHQRQELCALVGLQAKTYRCTSRRPDDAPIRQRLLYWSWSGGGVCIR